MLLSLCMLVSWALALLPLILSGDHYSAYHHDHQEILEETLVKDAEDWCSYVSRTPEPRLLIYNRIPKCGSSTTQEVVLRQVKDTKRLGYYSTKSEFWIDLSKNATILDKLYANVYDRLRGDPDVHLFARDNLLGRRNDHTLLVEGHFWGHNFDNYRFGNLGYIDIEYMQLMRECQSRAKSHLIYDLFEGSASQQYRHPPGLYPEDFKSPSTVYTKVVNRYFRDRSTFTNEAWVLKQAGPNRTIEECLNIPECFNNIPKVKRNRYADGFMAKFMFTSNDLNSTSGSPLAAATATALRPQRSKLLVVGLVEQYNEFLEMLECVYPTGFKGAAEKFASNPIHSRSSPPVPNNPSITNFTANSCKFIDSSLYKRMGQIFRHRYALMKSNPGKCCRKRKG